MGKQTGTHEGRFWPGPFRAGRFWAVWWRGSAGRGLALVFLLVLPLWGAGAVPGAAEMDLLLDTEAVSFAAAARWVLDAAGFVFPEGGAFAVAEREGLVPPGAEGGELVRLDELAFMLVRAFGLRGGIMYALIPGPRYAYRELRYRRILEGRIDPAQRVSGERLLRLLNKVLEERGES